MPWNGSEEAEEPQDGEGPTPEEYEELEHELRCRAAETLARVERLVLVEISPVEPTKGARFPVKGALCPVREHLIATGAPELDIKLTSCVFGEQRCGRYEGEEVFISDPFRLVYCAPCADY